jgi:hypothetical protein
LGVECVGLGAARQRVGKGVGVGWVDHADGMITNDKFCMTRCQRREPHQR